MKIEKCKGSRDLCPEQMARFRWIENAFRESCTQWGYKEVRTPTLEYLHLFTSTGTLTPALLNKVYSFLDWDGWGGERVVLRPDGTIPIARLYIDNLVETKLAKLFYVTNVFIFEESPEKARERWQCGVELIGADSPIADAELITLAIEILHKLKLEDIELKISHAGLIRAMLTKLGLDHEEQDRIFEQILDGDTEALSRIKPDNPALNRPLLALLELKGTSSGLLKNMRGLFGEEFPELMPSFNDFIHVVELLEALETPYTIDLDVGRGFEYYTGVIFHLEAGGKHIGGGGRYNALIPLMSDKNIPASGFALYLDLLMELLKPGEIPVNAMRGVQVRVDTSDPQSVRVGFDLVAKIHSSGCPAELNLTNPGHSEMRWMFDIKTSTLTDNATKKVFEINNSDGVLNIMQDDRADKNSPA